MSRYGSLINIYPFALCQYGAIQYFSIIVLCSIIPWSEKIRTIWLQCQGQRKSSYPNLKSFEDWKPTMNLAIITKLFHNYPRS